MELRKNPDGSVSIEDPETRRRVTYPTMEDLLRAQGSVAGGDFCDQAARYAIGLREDAKVARTNPDDPDNLETLSRTREAAGR